MTNLDKEEQELLDSYERGEWISDYPPERLNQLQSYAKASHLKNVSEQLIQTLPYLKMLILFGSRARGDIHLKSDWDFAVFYDEQLCQSSATKFDRLEIYNILSDVFEISIDRIDVVALNNCSPLLAFHIAKDGKVLYEKILGEFINFQMKAWKLYADTAKFRKLEQENIKLWLQKWGV